MLDYNQEISNCVECGCDFNGEGEYCSKSCREFAEKYPLLPYTLTQCDECMQHSERVYAATTYCESCGRFARR
jgi:hypothetical protein